LGANEARHLQIIPLKKGGEFSHVLQALGFSGRENFTLTQTGPGFTEKTSNEAYEAYHPIHRKCNGNRMYVKDASPFWADQGDATTTYAHVAVEGKLISNEKHEIEGTALTRYTAKDTTDDYLTLNHVHNPRYDQDGFCGQGLGDDKVKVEQSYIPHWDRAGTLGKVGPFEQLLHPLLSTGTADYNQDSWLYDTLPLAASVGMQEVLVDVQTFLDADAAVMPDNLAQRPLHPWKPGDSFADRIQPLCRLFGYALVWRRGKIALVDVLSPDTNLIDITINETVRGSAEDFPDMTMGIGTVVNRWTVKLTAADTSKKQTFVITDVDSMMSHSAIKEVLIETNGIPLKTGKVTIQDLLEEELHNRPLRFSSPIVGPKLAYALMYRVWAGGTVRFIATNLPDLEGTGDRSVNVVATVVGISWDYDRGVGECTLALHGQYSRWGQPYMPSALVDITAANGGWDAGNYYLTRVATQWGESGDSDDGAAVGPSGGEACKIVERAPSDPSSPQSWDVTVKASTPYETDGARILTLDTVTLTGWDANKEHVIIWDDYGDVTSDQQSDATYQADSTTTLLDSGGDNDPPHRYG
jgi:hypothetical protein